MRSRLNLLPIVFLALSAYSAAATSIDAVYFGQTHVQKTTDPYFLLSGNRETLIKAHVVDPATPPSPAVTAILTLNGDTLNLPLTGPATIPASVPDGPGVVQHTNADSFTAIIPAAWVKPGLSVTVQAGAASVDFPALEISAPTKIIMTMADVHFFTLAPGDYPAGWDTELEAKLPVSRLVVNRAADVVFPELVMPPSSGAPAVRVISKQDYVDQTGNAWDGENSAATAWNVALRRAAGRNTGYSLYYLNKYNVANEGVAGGYSGVGTGNSWSTGILLHELGHALNLPHWGDSATYPYKGAMYGIPAPAIYNETHAGPVWAFHLPTRAYIPCTTQPGNVGNVTVGTYKKDPMQGGGTGHQEPGYIFTHFSDYSVQQIRNYLQTTVVAWNETLGSYAKWNSTTRDYTNLVSNNGIQYPLLRDQSVISIIAAVSGASPEVCMVYPPIGPYTAGLIRLFDPTNADDRAAAISTGFSPAGGSDACLRVTQGGITKTYMLAASYNTGADPLSTSSLFTEGINLPAADGAVTRVELLLTPDAQINGLPADPQVLYTWTAAAVAPGPNPATFAVVPTADGPYSVTMTATLGIPDSDSNGRVEYLFTEITGKPGGSSSGWQSNPTYTDLGLQPNTEYKYTVTIRSGVSKAETTPSAEFAVTTAAGTATVTRLIARDAANTNGWLNGTWEPAIPSGTIDAVIAPGVGFRIHSESVPSWSGTLLMDTGTSIDAYAVGMNAFAGATHLTMRSAAIYDHFGVDHTFPAMTLEGNSFFQCNNYTFNSCSDKKRIFSGAISGTGALRLQGHRRMSYVFNQTNPFTGGLNCKANDRYIVELNAPGSAGMGNVTVDKRSADDRSAVLRLGADNVFHAGSTLTLNGKGWSDVTTDGGWAYNGRKTRIDMKTFNASVARLIIDGVEMPPGNYTEMTDGISDGTDWIDGTGTLTVTGLSPYLQWITGYPGVGFATGGTADPDGDQVQNLMEYAFGMNPQAAGAGSITFDEYQVLTPGMPTVWLYSITETTVDFRAVFARRKDHVAAGLTYTPQFASELEEWVTVNTTPIVMANEGNDEVDAVYIPYPKFIQTSRGYEKPKFFRVGVSLAP